jgi:peptidoglycan hydrolase-like protein with peptidoglycan-binding domain
VPERSSKTRGKADREDSAMRFLRPTFWLRCLLRRPRESLLAVAGVVAVGAIVVNAAYMQPGPHPAPMFAVKPANATPEQPTGAVVAALPRPRPAEAGPAAAGPAAAEAVVPARPRSEITANVQRELARRGFYDGAIDGAYGARTDAAIRDFEQSSGLRPNGEPTEALLQALLKAPVKPAPAQRAAARKDPIGDLLMPTKQISAVQRALSDFGYGQVVPNGLYGPETKAAIEKFERDRKLPVTGQISDRLLRELSSMTGRPL